MILHFWRRRYLILLLPPVFLVGSYLYIRSTGGETYQAAAMVHLREEASAMRTGTRFARLEPPVYQKILTNDHLLMTVIEDARARFPDYPQSGFERLRKAFTVTVLTTRETAVITEFSPALRLEVLSNTPERAHFLLTTWLARAEEMYGQVRGAEARELREAFEKEFDTIAAEVERLQGAEESAQQALQQATNLLMARNRSLYGSATGRIGGASPAADDGLLAERIRLELDLAEARASEAPEARARVAALNARMAKVDELIAVVAAEVEEATKRRAEQIRRIESARERLLAQREMLSDAREIIVNAYADTARVGEEHPGTFRVIAPPVMPEVRVGPPRAMYSIIAGCFLTAVLLALLLLEFYLRAALREERASR